VGGRQRDEQYLRDTRFGDHTTISKPENQERNGGSAINPVSATVTRLRRPTVAHERFGELSPLSHSETRQLVIGASCAIGAVAIWAGWLVMMRLGVTTRLSTTDLAALRFSVAGLVLFPIVLRRGFAMGRLGWLGFAAVVIGGGAPLPLVIGMALVFAPAAHAGALFQGVVPFAVACLAAIVLGERVPSIRKVGLLLIACGAVMIAGLGMSSLTGRQSIGHMLFLSSAFMWACYTVSIRRAGIDGLHAAAIAAVVSLLIYLPIYVVFFEVDLFNKPTADLVFQALYQGVLTAAISLALYGRAIRLLGASKAAAFVALGPPLTALMGIPVLGEWPSSVAWAAIVIITAGVYLASGGPLPTFRLRPSV
jgi:drug/metabolite transporter (DMT)-like permease